jgi:hypothetical protein
MAPFIAFVLLCVGVVVIVTVTSRIKAEKKLRTELLQGFGKQPELDENNVPLCLENIESISRYAELMEEFEAGEWRLDATTWNDLDMDKVFGRINICRSSVGEEYLYNALHELQQNAKALDEREALIKFLSENAETRIAAQMALSKVGKENYNGAARMIFDADERYLSYAYFFNIMAVRPIFGALVLLIHVPIGFFILFGAFLANIFIHHRMRNKLESDMPAVEYLHKMLACCKGLCKMNWGGESTGNLPTIDKLRSCFAIFKPIMHRLPAFENKGSLMDFDFLADYLRIIFLMDIRNYNKLVRAIKEHNREFHGLFKGIGEIETAICVINLRKNLPVWCVPDFTNEAKITFEDLIHPLLSMPVANDGEIVTSTLLTGSNASGKSTFVKSLALGGVLGQTINTIAATRFALRFSWVMTSMVMRDNITGGDSYFIVEIKSLRRIIERVRAHPCTCFIDEILRGTNTVERIAASTAMLGWLHGENCLCVAATHDIELTHLLADKYENFHFREQVSAAGVTFDYKIKNGASTTRNALKLLEMLDFSPEIIAEANKLANKAEQ